MNKLIKTISKLIRRNIKKITKNHYRKKYSKKLTNNNYTIFSSNCIGGIINNRVGHTQNSPTFNLWFLQAEFIDFLEKPKYWLDQELEFIESEYSYPVAKLGGVIHVFFTHYRSENEAREGWEKRKARIDWNNIYVIMYEDEVTREQLLRLLDYSIYKKIKVLTSSKDNLDLPFMQYIEKDNHNRENDYVFLDSDFKGKMTFEKQWDYVSWLNE